MGLVLETRGLKLSFKRKWVQNSFLQTAVSAYETDCYWTCQADLILLCCMNLNTLILEQKSSYRWRIIFFQDIIFVRIKLFSFFSLLVSKIFEKYIKNCCSALLFPLCSLQISVEINVCFFFAVLEACYFVKGLCSPSIILFAIPTLHPHLMPYGKPMSSKGIFSKAF